MGERERRAMSPEQREEFIILRSLIRDSGPLENRLTKEGFAYCRAAMADLLYSLSVPIK